MVNNTMLHYSIILVIYYIFYLIDDTLSIMDIAKMCRFTYHQFNNVTLHHTTMLSPYIYKARQKTTKQTYSVFYKGLTQKCFHIF